MTGVETKPIGDSMVELEERHGPTPQGDQVRGASLPARLYGSTWAHRLAPANVTLGLVSRVGPAVRERRNPAERRDAELFMRELLLHTERAGEWNELAEAWLVEKSRIRELFWRPWLLRGSSVEGMEHWRRAREGGSGCVIVFGHILATWAVPAILGHAGLDHYIIVGPHYWEPMPTGYEGLALRHRRRAYGERIIGNRRLISTAGRPGRLLELLRKGEAVAVAWDAPGRSPTPFLGRTIAVGGAAASLAIKTGSRVLPVVPERQGTRLHLRFYEPLDATRYDDARSLRAAIARAFEPIVLQRPHDVELAWLPCPLVTEPSA